MTPAVPTLRDLVRDAHALEAASLVARLGRFALVGPPAPPPAEGAPGFRWATEHAPRQGGAAHPMVSLLESVVYGIVKRPGSPFVSVVVVGRAPNSDLWIDDGRISKLHARIALDDPRGHVLSDAGSANGTFVDDQRLGDREERVLAEGTRVRFAERPFVVRGVVALHAMLRRMPAT